MNKINENRPGYKKTKVGWIPNDWSCLPLKNGVDKLISGASINTSEFTNEGVPVIAKGDVKANSANINCTNLHQYVSIEIAKKYKSALVCSDYLIITLRDLVPAAPTVGLASIILNNNSYILAQGTYGAKLRIDVLHPYYLVLLTRTSSFRKKMWQLATGSTQVHIRANEYVSTFVQVPPLLEQKKIAEILSTWDDAIQAQEKLITEKRKSRNAAAQKLLSEKGTTGARVRLSSFLKTEVRTVTKPTETFLALGIRCHGKGIFHKKDFVPEKIALDELFEVKKDDLIVNITFAWEGAIAIAAQEDDGGLVSHRFPTFSFNKNKVLPAYFKYVIHSKRFLYYLPIVSPGGAGRNRVMNKKDFLKLKVVVPSIDQQQKIADCLGALDREMEFLERKRDALKTQKKGLMQQLLTGAKRVKFEKVEA